MEVILLETIHKLGTRGQAVKVKPGYARNYLFPRNLALPSTPANRRVFHENERVLVKKDLAAIDAAKARATKFEGAAVSIAVQVGEEDQLYGSVSALDITRKLQEQGLEVERREVMLADPIRELGEFTVDVRLHREVSVPIKVSVVKE
ncbi:MAG TPA: 50S ribosomal protein L9 [Candidatus Krumholzibacteria bacterium]|nr:50S ribosomal protein L9 [Candidatus Krumholzibacteria bacterium]